jgi:alpha-beta hydrolase superfamily lysophospholipase
MKVQPIAVILSTAKDLLCARSHTPLLIGCLSFGATSLGAQDIERAVFLVRLGRDTLAVENATFTPGRVEGTLRYRTPLARARRVMMLSPSGELLSVETTTGAGIRGDSARTHSVLTVQGDSGVMRVDDPSGAGPPRSLRIAIPRGAVPFMNLSGVTLEMILRRARAIGADTTMVPLLLGNGAPLLVRVSYVGRDSAVMSLAGVDIRARTDGMGRFLGAEIPSQKAFIDRAPGDSPAANWSPVVPSYDAPEGAPYTAEPVTLHTPAGIALAGTLTLPSHGAGKRLPAVVLITGSGAQDRDEAIPSIGDYRPFREIADTLSRRGIAVLRLDDRGVGGSAAGPPTATSADFADDIRAALAWLRTRADIDPARLGLVGHSEGGMIAPMIAASDRTLRAMVLVAGPAKTGRAIAAYQRRFAIEHEASIPPSKRDSVFDAAERASESVYAKPGWIHFWINYDPLPTARRVATPTLILQGETDTQVTPEQSATLAAAMRAGGNRNVTLRTFPRMNHLMLEDASGDPNGYGRLSSYALRRDFLGVLADWLSRSL